MFAEFNWWLLIVGLVVGAGLTWLVLADSRRREVDLEEADVADEAVWIERVMAERGDPIDVTTAEHVLRLHRAYLGLPPVEPADAPAPDESAASEPDAQAEPDDRVEFVAIGPADGPAERHAPLRD